VRSSVTVLSAVEVFGLLLGISETIPSGMSAFIAQAPVYQ
jgi:hypothetical protein